MDDVAPRLGATAARVRAHPAPPFRAPASSLMSRHQVQSGVRMPFRTVSLRLVCDGLNDPSRCVATSVRRHLALSTLTPRSTVGLSGHSEILSRETMPTRTVSLESVGDTGIPPLLEGEHDLPTPAVRHQREEGHHQPNRTSTRQCPFPAPGTSNSSLINPRGSSAKDAPKQGLQLEQQFVVILNGLDLGAHGRGVNDEKGTLAVEEPGNPFQFACSRHATIIPIPRGGDATCR